MKRHIWVYISALVFLAASSASAVAVLSTDSGPSESTIKQGVSDGIFDTMAKHAGDWAANGMDSIGDWALQTLFNIYNRYMGTFLIKNPDLASPNTYTALAGDLANPGAASRSVSEVLNILKITSGTGLYLLTIFFVIDVGQRSSSLGNKPVEPNMALTFAAAFIGIFAWPYVFSLFTNASTALGYYIYNQNTLKTTGVLQGFANIDLNAGQSLNSAQMNQVDFRGNYIASQGIIWDFIFLLSIGLSILGFYNAYSAVSAGDSKSGNFKFFQAVSGIILILGVPTLAHTLISRGAAKAGSSPAIQGETLKPFSVKGLVQGNQIQYPPQQQQNGNNLGTAANNSGQSDESRMAKFGGGLLKLGAALWGLIVCFGVIFAKFFQVLNLWVLFILGPAFIGCLGHPSTAPIFWGAVRYFVKLLLYSVIWALTLVGLYLIPNINWGFETIGVNSLLTACAVIAGLQMIGNAQEFASLFTTFKGGNLRGDGVKDFARDSMMTAGAMNAARLKTFGGLKAMTGETGQAAMAAGGAALGSFIPGIGTAGGALMGQRLTKGANWMGRLGSIGGKKAQGDQGENPVQNLIKKFAGNVISKNLAKDAHRDFPHKESERRLLLGAYAKRLQRTGMHPNNRGTGGDRRGGHGDPA